MSSCTCCSKFSSSVELTKSSISIIEQVKDQDEIKDDNQLNDDSLDSQDYSTNIGMGDSDLKPTIAGRAARFFRKKS